MGSMVELLMSGTEHRVKQAEIEGNRKKQDAFNEREAASASLARFSQSISNERKLRAAGAAINAQGQNIANAMDAATTGTFGQRLAAAEELGAASVGAAAAGVGGGSVDAYRRTLMLNQAIQEEAQASALKADTFNAELARGDIINNAVADLNNDSYFGNFDYTIYQDHLKTKNVLGAMVAVGVASYFGGPQAGMATSDAIAGSNRYANGDRQGAMAYFNSAAANAASAYSQYRESSRQQPAPQLSSVPQQSKASGGSSGFGFWGSARNYNTIGGG